MATLISSTATSTATTAATSAASTASVNKSAAAAIMTSLSTGSGVDTDTLVGKLVEAQFAAKKAQLTSKYDTLTAQISGASTLKSNIADFAKAVDNLVKGGTLATQPTSSSATVATVSTISGVSTPANTNTTVKVDALASAQTATSRKVAAPATTTYGTGTLTLRLGSATYAGGAMTGFTTGTNTDGSDKAFAVTIDSGNNTLAGIAAAINARNAGVSASVVTDADGGAYLALKGQSGAAQAFTLTSDNSAGPLGALEVGPTAASGSMMAVTGNAANAKLVVDGVSVERASNEIGDLVPGVKLNLTGLGTTTLGGTRPEAALTNAVKDFAETYNQVLASVKELTDPVSGKLRADPAAKTLLRTLQGFASRTLLPDAAPGSPATLAAIGVLTRKEDGMMEVSETALARAMKDSPAAIEAMFAPTSIGATGINAAMQSLKLTTSSTLYGLGASDTSFRNAQSALTKQQDKVTEQSTRMSTRLTKQFSSMNSRVTAYKEVQKFMTQQIDAWTKSSS